jgi:hypothetical protein
MRERDGDPARGHVWVTEPFGYAQKSGSPSINLMRALELLRDFEPDLGPKTASAKAYPP